MTAETERKAIHDLWPAHIPHLVPPENRMGQPYTDTEHGIVCNCGDVLGWPENAPQPAEVVEVVEHRYDAAMDPSAMAGQDNPGATLADYPPTGDAKHDEPPWEAYEDYGSGPAQLGDDGEPGQYPRGRCDLAGDDPADEAQTVHHVAEPEPGRWDSAEDAELSADETRAARYIDVHLPPVTDVQLPAVAGDPADVSPVIYQGNPEDLDAVRRFAEQSGLTMSDDPPGFDGRLPARPTGVAPVADPLSDRVTIIDPTLPYGPEQVEHQLLRIEGQLERGIHFQRFWEERLHYAKVAFELANARALIAATGGDAATRKAQALLACEEEYTELQVCETMVRSVRECMHNLRSLQTGYQTISNSVGATYRSRPQGA